MYVPRSFRVQDRGTLARFVRRYSFATLLTATGRQAAISHVPLLLETAAGKWRLVGHVARVNDHWRRFGDGDSTAIFHGPHSYISPAWYADTAEVPTWNYAVVHAHGAARVVDDGAWLSDLVDRMVATYETGFGAPWDRKLAPGDRERQLRHIVGFALDVERVEGKFKLGQNRGADDQRAMLGALEAADDPDARALASFIADRARGT